MTKDRVKEMKEYSSAWNYCAVPEKKNNTYHKIK